MLKNPLSREGQRATHTVFTRGWLTNTGQRQSTRKESKCLSVATVTNELKTTTRTVVGKRKFTNQTNYFMQRPKEIGTHRIGGDDMKGSLHVSCWLYWQGNRRSELRPPCLLWVRPQQRHANTALVGSLLVPRFLSPHLLLHQRPPPPAPPLRPIAAAW